MAPTFRPLGFPWQTLDPFLFCVHHDDAYPRANAEMGPDASLEGRALGEDFAGKDGWRMYHGQRVPGFPQHPHRGFETVTVVRRGLIDHTDSAGATARYGGGDVQWLTAGKGINHSEMFPLLDRSSPNPLELFQIWLNLPRADKLAEPQFAMFWNEEIPRRTVRDGEGRTTEVAVIAGRFDDATAPTPPPRSWAARPENDVAIWTLKLAPGARLTLPPSAKGSNRTLYFFRGERLEVDGVWASGAQMIVVPSGEPTSLANGSEPAEVLVLQGKPIGEPVVQYGPFVMTTREELTQTFRDYQATGFGGWSWPSNEPVHPREQGRFARYPDGRVVRPTQG